MAFLEERPVENAVLAGQIQDNGLVHPRNRGAYFGYRDEDNILTGVALIGRNTLIEARTDDAITALANSARERGDIRIVFAPERQLAKFWRTFAAHRELPEVSHHDLLATTGHDCPANGLMPEIRLATFGDLDAIVAAHAEMVLAATGVDPMKSDAGGFIDRCLRRVENDRVWVWAKGRELIFKTDVVGHTSKAIYLEGLWVNPKARGGGVGTLCLGSLCDRLLTGSNVVCGFVERRTGDPLRSVYTRAGFRPAGSYAKVCI